MSLRPASEADLPVLRALYGTFRADEMALAPWPDEAKEAFLDSQFGLQHRHFTTVFAEADFLVVQERSRPIGRLYVDWGPPDALVIDIGLAPHRRGDGLGSALLTWTAGEARRRGAARLTLHVQTQNIAARRLYERLGLRVEAIHGAHLFMTRGLAEPWSGVS